MTAEISKPVAAAPSATLKVRVTPCSDKFPPIVAGALDALAVTLPFKLRLPAPVTTLPPFMVNEPSAPEKPFKSSRPELLIVTPDAVASC